MTVPGFLRRILGLLPLGKAAGAAAGAPREGCRLVAGLGNPGAEYAESRHNTGWQAVDLLLERLGAEREPWQPAQGILHGWSGPDGRRLLILKPTTYMNRSGIAVEEVMRRFSISPGEVLVICDDLDLPVGRLRLRRQGGSGGQKGIESIIAELGTGGFARLRIGIGRPEPGAGSVVDHVLGSWVAADLPRRAAVLERAVRVARCWSESGLERAADLCGRLNADAKEGREAGDGKIG